MSKRWGGAQCFNMQCVVTSQTLDSWMPSWENSCLFSSCLEYKLVLGYVRYFFYIRWNDNMNLLESVDVLYYIGWF